MMEDNFSGGLCEKGKNLKNTSFAHLFSEHYLNSHVQICKEIKVQQNKVQPDYHGGSCLTQLKASETEETTSFYGA